LGRLFGARDIRASRHGAAVHDQHSLNPSSRFSATCLGHAKSSQMPRLEGLSIGQQSRRPSEYQMDAPWKQGHRSMRSTAQAVTPEDVMTVSNDWITARTPRNQVRGDLIVAKGHPSKAF